MRPRSAGDCGRYYASAGTRRAANGTTSNHDHKLTEPETIKNNKSNDNKMELKNSSFRRRVRIFLPGQGPPPPKAGHVPIVDMILHWDGNQAVDDFAGEAVEGAGKYYTFPM